MMVSVLHKELQCRVEKREYNRKQLRNSGWWINRPSSVHTKFFSFTVYHLLVNNNRGRAGELKREGRLIEGIRYIKKITYSLNMQLVYQKRHRFVWTGAAWNRWVRMTFQPRFSTKPRPWVKTKLNPKMPEGSMGILRSQKWNLCLRRLGRYCPWKIPSNHHKMAL